MNLSDSSARLRKLQSERGFTLVEVLVVIVIIVILAGLAVGGYRKALQAARMTLTVTNLGTLTTAAHNWATDHGGKLPSPEYPGNYQGGNYPVAGASPAESKPAFWNLGPSGLWLDGVIFAEVYIEDEEDALSKTSLSEFEIESRATAGGHLVGTIFESTGSVESDRLETDWYRHSFAMNANLQFDGLHAEVGGNTDAWLTEKTLGNLPFQANAMLFIDSADTNVVMAEDLDSIIAAGERYGGKKVVVGYVDGHVQRVNVDDIPSGDINGDRDSSRFWRGVRED